MNGQITIFEYLNSLPKECSFSGHTCNKENLWEVADTFDDFLCPHVCCRQCNVKLCGARCNGSEEPTEKIYLLEIKGLMDDPYCPKCGYGFWTYGEKNETDCERCPQCHIRVDWMPWHRANDEVVNGNVE